MVLVVLLSGCIRSPNAKEVVVYAALDREFSEPILRDFEKQTGITVRTKFDTESTKTVGLTSQIILESKSRTRCDLFWNNEILNTLRLDELGLLDVMQPAEMNSFPATFRSAENRWFGFAARARVLIINTQLVAAAEAPTSIYDLADPKWKGKIGLAKPLFGTTATHAVCLFDVLGEAKARAFFESLRDNDAQILSGNKQVAEDVAAGRLAFGLTDTDDAIIEIESGYPVRIVYPDSKPEQLGTLFIPNTICILKGSPNHAEAKQLADFLLTASVEKSLAQSKSAQIPLSSELSSESSVLRVETPSSVHAMPIDFERAAISWASVGEYLREKFLENGGAN